MPDAAMIDKTCSCGNALVRDGETVKAHWTGSVCEDCEALIFARHNAPKCWRCKTQPGLVHDGTTHECIECAGETAKSMRAMLNQIDDAIRDGLTIWPKLANRVEFVRECIKLHREQAVRFGR